MARSFLAHHAPDDDHYRKEGWGEHGHGTGNEEECQVSNADAIAMMQSSRDREQTALMMMLLMCWCWSRLHILYRRTQGISVSMLCALEESRQGEVMIGEGTWQLEDGMGQVEKRLTAGEAVALWARQPQW
jgi:hypothetical protein